MIEPRCCSCWWNAFAQHHYAEKDAFFVFPIFIAITAIARLIVLQGKEMAPENVLFDAGAIMLLAIAAIFIERDRSP